MVFLGQGVNARVVRTEREGVEGCWRRTSGKLWSLMGFQMEREGYGLEIGSLVQHSEPKRDRRVSGYTEVIEDQSDVAVELAHFLRDTSDAFGFDETDGEASKSSDVFGAVAATDLASVFIVVPIQDVVAAVFHGPMASVDEEEALGVSLLGGSTGDAVSDLAGAFPGFFHDAVTFHDEGLTDMREVQVVIQFGGGPDLSDFDSPMVGWGILDELGFLTILEEEGDILKESFLVSFDGEMIMGLTLSDEVVGKEAVNEEGIGGYIFVFEIERFEQRDSDFDFVGLFEFFVIWGRDGAYFFWV